MESKSNIVDEKLEKEMSKTETLTSMQTCYKRLSIWGNIFFSLFPLIIDSALMSIHFVLNKMRSNSGFQLKFQGGGCLNPKTQPIPIPMPIWSL